MEEYISVCKKYGKKCVLEVKNRMKTDDLRNLVDEIKALVPIVVPTVVGFLSFRKAWGFLKSAIKGA